jgi:hypothetical protein
MRLAEPLHQLADNNRIFSFSFGSRSLADTISGK